MTAECLSHLSACAIRRRKARMAAKRFIKKRIAHKLNLFEFSLSLGSDERPRGRLPIHNRRGEFIHLFGALFSSSDSMNEISSFVVRKNSFFAFLHGRVAFLASSFFFRSSFFLCGNFRVFVDFWCQLNIRKAVNEADGLLAEKNTRARVPLNDHQVLRCHRSTREM